METIGLEEALKLKKLSTDVYQSVERPWTFQMTFNVNGGVLIGFAAAAAYETVPSDFSLKMLQAHFLAGPKPELPLLQRVHRTIDGGRFATRVIEVEQAGKLMLHVTCSFVRNSAMQGPSMMHSIGRASKRTIDTITLDDLEEGRTRQGPWMKFQRLPLAYEGPEQTSGNPAPESTIYTSAAQISPPIGADNDRLHILGILCLSDYHIVDCPPTLHRIPFGLPEINDVDRTPTHNRFKFFTSLNHTVYFHLQTGFRADDLCYIEARSPWANEQRAAITSNIFNREGKLIAMCSQEAFYAMKEKKTYNKL